MVHVIQVYQSISCRTEIRATIKYMSYNIPSLGSVWACSFWTANDTDLTMTTFCPGTDRDLETIA